MDGRAAATARGIGRASAAVGIVLAGALLGSSGALGLEEGRSLTVVGTGEVRITPDRAVLTISVVTRGDSAEAAAAENAKRSRDVLTSLREHLGHGDRAETLTYQVQPVYEYPKGGARRQAGFEVMNGLRVETQAVDRVGAIFDAVSRSADVSIDSLSFEAADPAASRGEALRLAALAARQRAEKIADGLGLTLRRVRSAREVGTGVPPPQPWVGGPLREAAASTPILPQELRIATEVEVTFDIE